MQCRQEIIRVCSQLHAKNWLSATDGNVSVRRKNSRIFITPTQRHKAFLVPKDICEISIDGKFLSGKPSGETPMHLAIYRSIEKARAIVHAHPPTAIAWSIARPDWTELPLDSLSEAILAVGKIGIVPYHLPGSEALGQAVAKAAHRSRVAILARHGAIAWGETLEEAYWGIERLEHTSEVLYRAQMLGGLSSMKSRDVEKLWMLRAKMGERTL